MFLVLAGWYLIVRNFWPLVTKFCFSKREWSLRLFCVHFLNISNISQNLKILSLKSFNNSFRNSRTLYFILVYTRYLVLLYCCKSNIYKCLQKAVQFKTFLQCTHFIIVLTLLDPVRVKLTRGNLKWPLFSNSSGVSSDIWLLLV